MNMPAKLPILLCLFFSACLAGCATRFPSPQSDFSSSEEPDGRAIFETCLAAHGGDLKQGPSDVNRLVSGEWSGLITRIQPLVTDLRYRIEGEERILPAEALYAARWTGTAGEKRVLRRPGQTMVHFNGERSNDPDAIASSALTSDAFLLFNLGPSFIKWLRDHRGYNPPDHVRRTRTGPSRYPRSQMEHARIGHGTRARSQRSERGKLERKRRPEPERNRQRQQNQFIRGELFPFTTAELGLQTLT